MTLRISASVLLNDADAIVFDVGEQLGKGRRDLMGSAAERGQLTNRVSHSTPRLVERAPDYEFGGRRFESFRARQ